MAVALVHPPARNPQGSGQRVGLALAPRRKRGPGRLCESLYKEGAA